eukprot:CAMPEP_0172531898 /NCGR_PEP_ID=MMETSP1067-20121228/5130_1 /TAXON_ID=265564 ORGANISM="Thalassiosira punctigera, Strain Tpunct2005C2" /NCGR_SAMPLE_ID=MMETSP1067 /ASSEMBLY_ACC=CAM_ASM_000444 /LENGTH=51 /DNA_ID=CAMNT_0013316335 /DNA_START=60 /DNA_END=212 /DNA_ORIENTATION=+
MTIADLQRDLLARLNADYERGLTSSDAARRRGELNNVRPPLNCPKWVCCLL